MRLRALAPWILLPPLSAVLLAAWFVNRSVTDEREDLTRIGFVAVGGDVVLDANTWISAEITNLGGLRAFTSEHPGLADFDNARDAYASSMTREQMYGQLQFADGKGAEVIDRLRARPDVPAEVRQVLEPLDDETMNSIANGESIVDPGPYAAAIEWLFAQYQDSDSLSAEAGEQLVRVAEAPPFWRERSFGLFLGAAVVMSFAGAAFTMWRLHASMKDGHARLEHAEARSKKLEQLISAARRLSSESDFRSTAKALMAETRELLGGELATLALREGARLEPVASTGELPSNAVSIGEGAVGRCVETGWATRVVVPSDPFLPNVNGPISLLAAPLVADGQLIGAIVIASRSDRMFDEDAEATLQLLALLAAGAVTAAQRYDSTVALALRDPLTGLANRRRLDHDLSTAAVTEAEVAFLMVDIDHFKSYNDEFGHQRGDELLQMVAAAISGAVRDGDIVYRYGGEEFSVLLPGTDAATAATVAERVRAAVTSATVDALRPVTVSVGIATQSAPVSPDVLVERADSALYAAKQDGRDRVSTA